MSQTRRCSNCIHWVETLCRKGPPSTLPGGSAVFPVTAPDDWCGSFSPITQSVGQKPKVSDEEIIAMLVKETTEPVPLNDGRLADPVACKRSEFVNKLLKLGMTRTPALKRLAKLARQGRINMGENPWPNEVTESGIHVWGLTEKKKLPAPVETSPDRETTFLIHIRGAAPAGHPLSMRKLVAGCGLDISVPTGARWLKKLIHQGVVYQTDGGYCATPAGGEIAPVTPNPSLPARTPAKDPVFESVLKKAMDKVGPPWTTSEVGLAMARIYIMEHDTSWTPSLEKLGPIIEAAAGEFA